MSSLGFSNGGRDLEPLSEDSQSMTGIDGFVGRSPYTLGVARQIEAFSGVDIPLCITGETGTGKTQVASLIHQLGSRANKPFIPVNCGHISKEMAPSLLFGHRKGSFTSASYDHRGYFEQAHGGTLFLDEIFSLDPSVQVEFLRVLEDFLVVPVGRQHQQAQRVDVRVIAATNQPLDQTGNGFRPDLYYRLNGVTLDIPPLRSRQEDIHPLIHHFLSQHPGDSQVPTFDSSVFEFLEQYPWPGNVRQLKRVIEVLSAFCKNKTVTLEVLRYYFPNMFDSQMPHTPVILRQVSQARDPLFASSSQDDFRKAVDAVVADVAGRIGNALAKQPYSINLQQVERFFRNGVVRALHTDRNLRLPDITARIGYTKTRLGGILRQLGLRRIWNDKNHPGTGEKV